MNGPTILKLADRGVFRKLHPPALHGLFSQMDFDQTRGFPGEGPVLDCVGLCFLLCLVDFFFRRVPRFLLFRSSRSCFACCNAVGLLPLMLGSMMLRGAYAMPIVPNTAGEVAKAKSRASQPPLPIGRPVMPTTGSSRERFLEVFRCWLNELGYDLTFLLDNHYLYIDDLNVLLSRYGRELFAAGKSYNQCGDDKRSLHSTALRRQRRGIWDTAGQNWSRLLTTRPCLAKCWWLFWLFP